MVIVSIPAKKFQLDRVDYVLVPENDIGAIIKKADI